MIDETRLVTIDSAENSKLKVEIMAYTTLAGSDDIDVAAKIFLLNEARVRSKMVKFTLKEHTTIKIEPGALYFMKGNLELESKIQGGLAKGLFRKFTSGETLFQSTITGTGEVYLEPSFGYYLLLKLNGERFICDKGAYVASSGDVQVNAEAQKNVSSALAGGEGFFQTALESDSEEALVVLKSPAPMEELMTVELEKNEKLTVDGNFALARTSQVQFRAEKSGGSFLQTLTSGELLLQTFTGPGIVFIAPTEPVYDFVSSIVEQSKINGQRNQSSN